jgi:hypothetical protein
MKVWDSIISLVHKIPRGMMPGLLVVSALILFLPDKALEKLYLVAFRDQFGMYVGIAFLLLIVINIWILWDILNSRFEEKRLKRVRIRSLHELTPEEKGYLVPLVIGQKNTIYVGIDDGIAGGLVANSILFRSSNIFTSYEGAPYNLQPWAREHLHEHPELLEGHVGTPMSPEQKMQNRW